MRKRDRSLLSNAVSLLVCGLLAGVVVAAAAFPIVAMSGLVAKAGADSFDRLPSALTVQQSPQITYVYASDGKTLLSTFFDENRLDVKLGEVAEVMQQAMVAAEDTRFYEHHGVDAKGVARAFVANQSSGDTAQGASTLTMQYVRLAIEYSASAPQDVVDATANTPAARSGRCATPSPWRSSSPRRRSWSDTSTSRLSAAAPSASTPRRRCSSASRPRT